MRKLDRKSFGKFKNTGYEVTLRYLKYGEGESNKLSFPIQVRERHLTQGPTECQIQGIGSELQITAWSSRDNIIIRLPLKTWKTTKTYRNLLSGPNNGHLAVGRFQDELEHWKTEDGYRVKGILRTHDWDKPSDEE